MALIVQRNPNGPGYVLVDDRTGERRGSQIYDSARGAQDAADQDNAWTNGGRTQPGADDAAAANERLTGAMAENEARRQSAANPDDQRGRMDRGESRSSGYYDPYADDSSGQAANPWDEDNADIPIWGWLTGAQARRDAARAQGEADRAESRWEDLSNFMPTPDDLAVQYEEEGSVGGPETSIAGSGDPESEAIERRALAGLMDIGESGGITDSDRARMQLGAMDVGRQARASREADMAALQARGMGGSGTQIASTLGASQAGIDGLYQRDAEIQARAQDRAMDALSQGGSFAGQMRGERFREGGAQDDLNRWNTDYQRGREERNTRWRNRTNESRSESRQQAYENRERQAAGLTNQWQAASGGARADQRRQDEANQAGGTLIGVALEEIL